MFTVSGVNNRKLYTVYDVKLIDDKTMFLIYESAVSLNDTIKASPEADYGWNWLSSSLFIPTSLR